MNQFGYEVTSGRLDPTIKADWIAALRSGKYTQARETLRINGGFCCLGVLCDVIDPTGWKQHKNDRWKHVYKNHTSVHSLGESILNLINPTLNYRFTTISVCRMFFQEDKDCCHLKLADLNDIDRLSFDQIADVIQFFL